MESPQVTRTHFSHIHQQPAYKTRLEYIQTSLYLKTLFFPLRPVNSTHTPSSLKSLKKYLEVSFLLENLTVLPLLKKLAMDILSKATTDYC